MFPVAVLQTHVQPVQLMAAFNRGQVLAFGATPGMTTDMVGAVKTEGVITHEIKIYRSSSIYTDSVEVVLVR